MTEQTTLPTTPKLPKPPWMRVKAPGTKGYQDTQQLMRHLKLHTVCEEAACPNIGECWDKGHATVMILGSICTRACAFCNVQTGTPEAVDSYEPLRVAKAVGQLGLQHVVVTSVDRDDLEDGGAEHFVKTIQAIRKYAPTTTIEILTPDFLHKKNVLEKVVAAKPDVFNHNIETVPGLYAKIRPGARYFHSLHLLKTVKEIDPSMFTKSGLMVGLGEKKEEVYQLLDDLRAAEVDFVTIGQYAQPTPRHAPLKAYVTPEEFERYGRMAKAKGFLMVSSSPLTRSSYHAGDDFKRLREAREAALQTS